MAIKKLQRSFSSQFSSQAGVTLIEMLVVVGIIAIVSAALMFNYSDFSTNVSVRNLSQEIALSVRKAQTYATSVRALDGTSGVDSDTFPGYGISFSTRGNLIPPDVATAGPSQFILFVDSQGPVTEGVTPPSPLSSYDKDAGETTCGKSLNSKNECLESFGINSADKIDAICIDSEDCTANTNTQVDITFRRPSPDAIICEVAPVTNCTIGYITINLLSAKGLKRSVQIWNTGQISVK